MSNLDAIETTRKAGSEPFHVNGVTLSHDLLSFWQWSSSELVGNALRGMLAEYIVALDLGCADGVRKEWDSFDIETTDGIKVEVKSAAFLQSWPQKAFSPLRFDIKPTYGWDATKNASVSEERVRQSDVYVFCTLEHRDKTTVDPLDLSQWRFYVLPTLTLNETVGNQKTIAMSRLLKLAPEKTQFGQIASTIRRVMATDS